MSSIVLDLQQEILKIDCDILNALRKAHLIAAKLRLNEFDKWIQLELNGYANQSVDSIPEYRTVRGALKAFNPYNGWIPAQCTDDEIEKCICARKLAESVGAIQDLYRRSTTGTFMYQFPAEQMDAIASMFDTPMPMQYAVHVGTHQLKEIIEKVKNCLLEWTIRLEEEGVLGEGMRFTNEETNAAGSIPQQINNYYGTVINGSVSQSQVVSGNSNTVSYITGDIKSAIKEISESIDDENISSEDKETALELLNEISQKLEQGKKPGIIKSALVGLKDFLWATGANVTAALITAKIQGLF